MRKAKKLFYIIFILLTAVSYSQEQNGNPGSKGDLAATALIYKDRPEDIFLSLKYLEVIDTTIDAIYYNGRIALPLKTVLQLFKIPFSDANNKLVFTSPSESKIELEPEARKMIKKDSSILLKKDKVFLRTNDIYIEDKVLENILSIKIIFDFYNLSIKIESSDYLPVYKEYLREQNYRFLRKEKGKSGPLLYPLEKDWIAGGILDYQLSSYYTKMIPPFYNYQLDFGGVVGGGELKINLNGSIINSNNNLDNINYLWNYILDKSYLTKISAGDQNIEGINSYYARTITLTNEPATPRRIYNLISIDGLSSPFSTVEMYTNGRLTDFIRTGAAGVYNFSTPLSYGTTIAKIISYDKEGNINSVKRLFQIPEDFIPEGEFNYKLSVGTQADSRNIFSLASASMGITNRLSNTSGIEYLKDNDNKNPVLFNSLKARFFSNLLLDLTLAPTVSYSISLNSISANLQTFNVQLKKYDRNLFYNPTNIKNEATVNLYFPFHFKHPLNLGFSGRFSEYEKIHSYEYKIESDGNFGNFHPIVNFRQLFIEDAYTKSSIDAGFFFSIPQIRNISSLFQGNLLSLKTNYNFNTKKFDNLYLIFSSTFYKYTRFQFTYINDFSGDGRLQFQLIAELPFTRTTTMVSENTFSQGFQGSINYDMSNKSFFLHNRMNSGKATAIMNMFVDRNNDGKYEQGEEKINGRVILEGASSVLNYNGDLYFYELTPYAKYSVTVDENSIKNPLFKPVIKTFTFIAGPDIIKQIDIPFYVAGEISGEIVTHTSSINPGGFLIFAEDTSNFITRIRPFGDGSFYYFGLKPGHYKIYINPAQLTGIRSIPDACYADIKPAGSDNSVPNLVFELK